MPAARRRVGDVRRRGDALEPATTLRAGLELRRSRKITATWACELQALISAARVASLSTQTTAGRPDSWDFQREKEASTAKSSTWQMGFADRLCRYTITLGSMIAMK